MPAAPDIEPQAEPEAPDSLALAAPFPTATREQWRRLVAGALAKGGRRDDPDAVEDLLAQTTYDGVRIAPLYTADDAPDIDIGWPGHPPFVRGATEDGASATGWDVRTRHADADPARVNRAVLADLERGATSLWLVLGDGGLAVHDLPAALDGVHLDLAPLVFELTPGVSGEQAELALLSLGRQRHVDPAELRGSLGLDPVGGRARTGADADLAPLAAAWARHAEHPNLQLATVDATVFHDAGASDAQEVGIGTAVGVAYLRAFTEAGATVDEALAALEFRWAVTAEQFPSVAKLRAARRVWDRVAELSGAADDRRGQRQHAVTSAAMMTRRDPWVNLLRTTIACFAAAVGGAEAITVAPFDSALGISDDFARRIARNTQSVLHDESSLARVVDPAGGSWFVESLTDRLAEAAWTVFTDIEKNGGVLARLDDGTVESFLAGTRARRDDDIAHRRKPITGVSEFAFVDEDPVERPAAAAPPAGLLPRLRYAREFEALRERSDAAATRPTVSVVAMGATANSPRVAFVRNLFHAGGLRTEVTTLDEFTGGVVCLAGADRQYADEGSHYVRDLRAKGATLVWVAGEHADVDADGRVFTDCDALGVLRRTLDALEVAG